MSYADLNDRTHEVALNRMAAAAPHLYKYVSTINPVALDPKVFMAPMPVNLNRELLMEVPSPVLTVYRFAASLPEVKYTAREVVKMQTRAVSVEAPPGVGKSTVMPGVIDSLVEEPVLVLEPTVMLAKAQAETVLRNGGKAVFVDACAEERVVISKEMGVIYMTPAGMLALLAREGCGADRASKAYYVIHDECHENDGATYALRMLWPAYPQIKKYILTSATLGSASNESLQRHNSAPPLRVIPCRFKEELEMTPSDRMADGNYAPWSIYFLKGKKSLMFIERDKVASLIDALYGRFMPVKVLRRDSSYEEYLEAAAACQQAGPEGILIVVDSAYQTGYTFEVDLVVDFGIRRQTVDSGANQLGDQYRAVTVAERRQRVERVARTHAGLAYVPDTAVAGSVSILGPGIAGHVAAWCTLLGFKIPRHIYVSDVDRMRGADLCKFFSSGMPWELWAREYYQEVASIPEVKETTAAAADMASEVEEEEPVSADSMFAWASQLRAQITMVDLLSGEFYATEDGSVVAEPAVIEALADGIGDMYSWLRERICPKGVKLLSDATPVEASLIWSIWMTAWNNNVARLIALKQWKATYGVMSPGWQGSPECRAVVANLFSAAEDIRDKWELLKAWYLKLFAEFPLYLKVTAEVVDLVEAQYRVIKGALGVGASPIAAVDPIDVLTARTKYLLTGDSSSCSSKDKEPTSIVDRTSLHAADIVPKAVMAKARIDMATKLATNSCTEAIPWGSHRRALRGRGSITRSQAGVGSLISSDKEQISAYTYVFPKRPGLPGTWR